MPGRGNLVGREYGRLLVVAETQGRKERRVVYECRCTCGATVYKTGHDLKRGHAKSCGCLSREKSAARIAARNRKQIREKNPNWNGGRSFDKIGYVLVLTPEHPSANRHGYVYEHRLVMEAKLGRYLTSSERVHHLDGNPQNNSIENLVLFTSDSQHSAYHRKLERMAVYD